MTCRSESRDELRAEISRDGPSLVCRQSHCHWAACRPTRKHAELEPRGAELDWHLDVVPRAEAHLGRLVPRLDKPRRLRMPPHPRHPRLGGAGERREHHQIRGDAERLEPLRRLLRLRQTDLVERVLGLVDEALVHARLGVACSQSSPCERRLCTARSHTRGAVRCPSSFRAGSRASQSRARAGRNRLRK